MSATTPIINLKGVGEAQANRFASLGIKTVADLLNYFPRRYDDFSEITPINKLKPGQVSVKATIKQAKGRYVRRGIHITEAVASDDTGSLRLIWFNQPYRAESLKQDADYFISGIYELRRQKFSVINPSVELVSDFPINTARILSIYRETKKLNSRQIRLAVREALKIAEIKETLPTWILEKHHLLGRAESVKQIHTPESSVAIQAANRRLGFEEVFELSLASLFNKLENQSESAVKVPFKAKLAQDFVRHLPFKLTNAQRRTVWQIYQDLEKSEPMNRLIEGDVGSGKTAVAAMAALMVIAQDKQVALMAPTEILARQHAETIHKLLEPLGFGDSVVLLVGSQTAAQKSKAREAIRYGQAKFMIGTQALIQEKVDMHKLALIIIDEQHRFGVDQRKVLMAKAGHMPHVLSLTATPIPRSLALTLYGEMDISVLDEKPTGRKPAQTELIAPTSRQRLYKAIEKQLDKGSQMFVVCPLIEDSDYLAVNSAEKVYEQLKSSDFKHRRIGLLHGKLKSDAKQVVMEKFINRELDILVSTTVIEVGVDVPNASIMMIESPERFGLAQLHQLRGRVGRGQSQSYCYLMLSDSQAPSRRLHAMSQTNDGFKLAELDLELRGPGAIYGTSQHGQLDLRIAKLTDSHLIMAARSAADDFIRRHEDLLKYKHLAARVKYLRAVTNLN